MLRRLQTTLKKGLLLSFLALGLPQVGKADSPQAKKDVFLIDVSRSMQGHGSVSTPNVFDDVKRELITAFGKAKASKAVLIPFSDKVCGGVSVELPQDSSVIRSYIEQLRTSDGRTDIYRAWEVGLDSLHSDASGYRLYLITDALHNSKRYDIDSLRSLLSHWEGEQKDAYLVLLNPAFESSELANIFRANERMYVINSLQDLYNDAQVDTTKTIAVASPQQESAVSTKSSEHSLWWLWLLLALIVVGGVVYYIRASRKPSREDDVPVKEEPKEEPEEEPKEPEKLKVPTGAKSLRVVDDFGKLVPEINNLGDNAHNYTQEFNDALFRERRKAVTPSHQFPTAYQLQQPPRYAQTLGDRARAATLRRNMYAFMDPKMQRIVEAFGGVDAHHVVEGTDPAAQGTRQLFEEVNLDINDAANGIFLPDGSEASIFKGAAHLTSHTAEYSQWVYERLLPYRGNREAIIAELTRIKHDLYDGKMSLQGENQVYNKNIRS